MTCTMSRYNVHMTDPARIDIGRIRDCLKPFGEPTGLAAHAHPRHSDFDLNRAPREQATVGQQGQAARPGTLREAAVLVPLVVHEHGFRVLLTQRTDHLHHHAGQICFPGGRVDDGDEDHLATALRETHEEVGLEAQFLEPLGLLDDYETGTNFLVTPVVALVQPGFTLELEEFEVAEVFEIPLQFLFDKSNHQIQSSMRDGERRHYYVFEYEDRYIWGATAGMLMNFYRRVHGLPGPVHAAENLGAVASVDRAREERQ
jgi:8-oxo-dGTP pyrophosphatase MutT (NUDIX family)